MEPVPPTLLTRAISIAQSEQNTPGFERHTLIILEMLKQVTAVKLELSILATAVLQHAERADTPDDDAIWAAAGRAIAVYVGVTDKRILDELERRTAQGEP